MTGKYTPLKKHFQQQSKRNITLPFSQIEKIISGDLPQSAFQYTAWWTNEKGGTRHVQCKAWLDAGWEVDSFSLNEKWVRFTRQ